MRPTLQASTDSWTGSTFAWCLRRQEVLLELCMIMPARLSDLLSVLSRIMPPLVRALKANPELVTLALRTLEYWVDR